MKVDAFGADSDPITTAHRAYQAPETTGLIKTAVTLYRCDGTGAETFI